MARKAPRQVWLLIAALVATLCGCSPPPAPEGQRFADLALAQMDRGMYASGDRWRAARQHAVEQTRGAMTEADALPALREALIVAGGRHSSFVSRSQQQAANESRVLPSISVAGGIATVVVPSTAAFRDQAFMDHYRDTLAGHIHAASGQAKCGWIVDLRRNGGGSYLPMVGGLTPLLPDGPVAEFHIGHDVKVVAVRGGEVTVDDEVMTAARDYPKNLGAVAVLQDEGTASAAEVTLAAFDGRPRTRSFGWQSAGYTTTNIVVSLGADYDNEMVLSVGILADRRGRIYGTEVAGLAFGGPIEPDVATLDPVPSARAWLRKQC